MVICVGIGCALKTAYDQETVELLRTVLDQASDALLPYREQISKSHMAECVLRHAAAGERPPSRLRSRAIADAVQEIAAAQRSEPEREHGRSVDRRSRNGTFAKGISPPSMIVASAVFAR
jgi:hypothetical protein